MTATDRRQLKIIWTAAGLCLITLYVLYRLVTAPVHAALNDKSYQPCTGQETIGRCAGKPQQPPQTNAAPPQEAGEVSEHSGHVDGEPPVPPGFRGK